MLCAGIIVLDEVFRVDEFPQPDGKVQAKDFFVVNGGCAANAAVAIARLGGRAALAGPMGGPAGEDANGDRVLKALTRENVDCTRLPARRRLRHGAVGDFHQCARRPHDRDLSRRAHRRDGAGRSGRDRRGGADMVLADNRYPAFVQPICAAARRRGMPVVLDGDRPTVEDDPLFRIASHVIFSSECLRETTGRRRSRRGLARIARNTDAFLAVSNGPDDIVYIEDGELRRLPVFKDSTPSIRSAPGDAFHGGFALALAEGEARSKPCASAPPSPASNARGLAVRRARRRGRSREVVAETAFRRCPRTSGASRLI